MVVTVRSLGLTGIRGYEVSVECFLSGQMRRTGRERFCLHAAQAGAVTPTFI